MKGFALEVSSGVAEVMSLVYPSVYPRLSSPMAGFRGVLVSSHAPLGLTDDRCVWLPDS